MKDRTRQRIERGRRSDERGDDVAALADFREALKLNPRHADMRPARLERTDARPRPLAVS